MPTPSVHPIRARPGQRHRLLRTLAILASLIAAPLAAPAQPLGERLQERMQERRSERDTTHTATSGLQSGTLVHDGLPRSYLVHLPRAHRRGERPLPLVLAYHGGGGDAAFMADDDRYGWISQADSGRFILVFPGGFSQRPSGKFATWNAGSCCGDARDRGVDDVGFTRALVRHLQVTLPVDRQRIYATGMSNGGMMAHRLACEAADLFAAVASVAGTDGTDRCTPSQPIGVLHIHALNDTHVLFQGGAGEGAFRDRSKVTDFTSVPETFSRWLSRNRCETPARRTDRPGAYCESSSPCAGGVRVQLCVTETGGHSWPGADKGRRGKEQPSQALSASEEIWSFFQAHRRP